MVVRVEQTLYGGLQMTASTISWCKLDRKAWRWIVFDGRVTLRHWLFVIKQLSATNAVLFVAVKWGGLVVLLSFLSRICGEHLLVF